MTRKDLQSFQECLGFHSSVSLGQSDHDVGAVELSPATGGQHLEGLTDPRSHAEVDLQPPPALRLGVGQQGVGIRAKGLVGAHYPLGCATG